MKTTPVKITCPSCGKLGTIKDSSQLWVGHTKLRCSCGHQYTYSGDDDLGAAIDLDQPITAPDIAAKMSPPPIQLAVPSRHPDLEPKCYRQLTNWAQVWIFFWHIILALWLIVPGLLLFLFLRSVFTDSSELALFGGISLLRAIVLASIAIFIAALNLIIGYAALVLVDAGRSLRRANQ